MNKEVTIGITGIQVEYADTERKENEPIEIICPATYFFKNGLHYIFYEEVHEGSTSIIQNKIVFKENDYLEVKKKGGASSHMFFCVEKEHTTNYETPYGEMTLGVTTRKLNATIEERVIQIEASYDLAINCEEYASCKIMIRVMDKELCVF